MKNIVRFSGILAFVAVSVFYTTTVFARPAVGRGVIIKKIHNNSPKTDIKPNNAQPNKTQPSTPQPEVNLGAPVNNNGAR